MEKSSGSSKENSSRSFKIPRAKFVFFYPFVFDVIELEQTPLLSYFPRARKKTKHPYESSRCVEIEAKLRDSIWGSGVTCTLLPSLRLPGFTGPMLLVNSPTLMLTQQGAGIAVAIKTASNGKKQSPRQLRGSLTGRLFLLRSGQGFLEIHIELNDSNLDLATISALSFLGDPGTGIHGPQDARAQLQIYCEQKSKIAAKGKANSVTLGRVAYDHIQALALSLSTSPKAAPQLWLDIRSNKEQGDRAGEWQFLAGSPDYWQTPYVTLAMELADQFEPYLQDEKFHLTLAAVLIKFLYSPIEDESIDPQWCVWSGTGVFQNGQFRLNDLSPSHRVMISAQARSCAVAIKDFKAGAGGLAADHVFFAVGLERMRWHSYAIANVFLDHFQIDFLRSISELSSKTNDGDRETQGEVLRSHKQKLTKEILDARIRALGLIQENILFRGTPTSVLAISQELSRMFQTEQLSRMIEFKLSELDRLQMDLNEYSRQEDLRSTGEWWKSVWK